VTAYDEWLPVAREFVEGVKVAPGVEIDREKVAQIVAQALHAAAKPCPNVTDSVPPANAVE
jgi:hypothetical protein